MRSRESVSKLIYKYVFYSLMEVSSFIDNYGHALKITLYPIWINCFCALFFLKNENFINFFLKISVFLTYVNSSYIKIRHKNKKKRSYKNRSSKKVYKPLIGKISGADYRKSESEISQGKRQVNQPYLLVRALTQPSSNVFG